MDEATMEFELEALQALSPLDGRYARGTLGLREYWSEFALIRGRLRVEIEYLIALTNETPLARPLTAVEEGDLRKIAADFTPAEARHVKTIERVIRHDVKAVEYYLRDKLASTFMADLVAWLHLGLTSEDVNSIAQALALRDSRDAVLVPSLDVVLSRLVELAREYKRMPMLARTHGQPAVPTTLGKELAVFVGRLKKQRAILDAHPMEAKLTGAVGNFNALLAAAPQVDWPEFSVRFIRRLGLEPNLITTQILPYDNWVKYFDAVRLTNSILIDLAQDLWRYIGLDYFSLRVEACEVGSSTMPQKVNPIDFENAEGNLGIANALLAHYANKLPISRLQRDLTDSTVRRTFGVALGHTLVAYQSLARGLGRLEANEARLRADLAGHWEVGAEGAQTILRAAGMGEAYETLKELTRGKSLTAGEFQTWVETLPVEDQVKARLRSLSPFNYLGLAERLVDLALEE
jgi:adenylosuccinate lyase